MKKQNKVLLIFSGILVLLLLIWAASSFWPGDESEETSFTTTAALAPLFESEMDQISRINIKSSDDQFTLVPAVDAADDNEKRVWRIEGMEDYPFAAGNLESLASLAAYVSASREIELNADDLDQYGLVDPTVEYTVEFTDGTSHVIKFGKQLPTGSYHYAMLDQSGRVCAVPSATADRAAKTRLDLLDAGQVVGINAMDLTGFTFERDRDQVRLVSDVMLVGEPGSGTEYLDFQLLEPVRRSGNPENLMKLVNEVAALTVDAFVEIDPLDLAVYGLDQPQYTFELTTDVQTVTVSLGSLADSDHFYAISDAVPAVFTVPRSAFATIDMRIIDMLDRFVQLISIWNVEKIEADILGESFVVEIATNQDQKPTDEEVVYILDGEDAKIVNQSKRSLFSNFYQRLISVMIAGLDVEAEPVNTADAVMIFHLKEEAASGLPARKQVVEFASRDDYTYYVFIDGQYTGFYIDGEAAFHATRTDSEGILVALQMMRYAIDNAVDGVFDTQKGYPLN